jgi:hypothetical protein
MYLYCLLGNHLSGPVCFKCLGDLGLLELGTLGYSGPSIAVLVPPLVAPLTPAALETVLTSSVEGRRA